MLTRNFSHFLRSGTSRAASSPPLLRSVHYILIKTTTFSFNISNWDQNSVPQGSGQTHPPPTVQSAVRDDDRAGDVYIQGRGTVMTYIFEVSLCRHLLGLPASQHLCHVPGAGQHLQVLGPSVRRLVAATTAVGGQHGFCQRSSPTSNGENVLLNQRWVFVFH